MHMRDQYRRKVSNCCEAQVEREDIPRFPVAVGTVRLTSATGKSHNLFAPQVMTRALSWRL
jgi:hypothetical protein